MWKEQYLVPIIMLPIDYFIILVHVFPHSTSSNVFSCIYFKSLNVCAMEKPLLPPIKCQSSNPHIEVCSNYYQGISQSHECRLSLTCADLVCLFWDPGHERMGQTTVHCGRQAYFSFIELLYKS